MGSVCKSLTFNEMNLDPSGMGRPLCELCTHTAGSDESKRVSKSMPLKVMQEWFAKVITSPLQKDHRLPLSYGEQSARYLKPSAALTPLERIEIYHQQYWWRLVKCLHIHFPSLVRLFGEEDFQNLLAIPYLTQYPPDHWGLNRLGDRLSFWLHETYQEEDRYLVTELASIDWGAQEAFWQESLPPITAASAETPLMLQPFIHLFSLKGDFFTFRDALLKQEPAYYDSNPFPLMTYEKSHFVLYRTAENMVTWRKIPYEEYWMLSQFKRGSTLENVCAELETLGGELLEKAMSEIPLWFKQWTVLKWFRSLSS